jgi:hypothetical protein
MKTIAGFGAEVQMGGKEELHGRERMNSGNLGSL